MVPFKLDGVPTPLPSIAELKFSLERKVPLTGLRLIQTGSRRNRPARRTDELEKPGSIQRGAWKTQDVVQRASADLVLVHLPVGICANFVGTL